MTFEPGYQRAAEAIALLEAHSLAAHNALFDLAAELGAGVNEMSAHHDPVRLAVRFIRKPPPHLGAPAGVTVEEAEKDRSPAFAAVVLSAQDLWLEIRSDPGVAVDAVTNIAALAPFADALCGINVDGAGRPRLITSLPQVGLAGSSYPTDGEGVLRLFLEAASDVFVTRGAYNGAPVLLTAGTVH
jgi:hypothetical protein